MFYIKDNKGFTLILALIVLALLSVMMGLFITMVSVNLRNANRFVAKTAIEQVADDGIKYCDKMLVSSADGADWRPIPENISMDGAWLPAGINTAPPVGSLKTDYENIANTDPDYEWLIPYWPVELRNNGVLYAGPNGGYTRVNSGGNRFLVRVTYSTVSLDPNSGTYVANYYDSNSKFIKIESIGRKGNVDPDDPTTMKPYGNVNTKFYLLAYKPIGITDYARFITNKDRQKKTFDIGCGRIQESYGRENTRYTKRGAPIRVNGSVKFNSVNLLLRGKEYTDINGDKIVAPRDMLEATGKISGGNTSVYNDNGVDITSDVDLGDFKKEADANGVGVSTISAPLIDSKGIANGSTRYRDLTKNTGNIYTDGNSKGKRAGEFGWGDGIYINNAGDVQRESETLFGGYTLRSDWLNPGNLFSGNWRGPYYIPPGVVIELTKTGIIIQRTDFDTRNTSTIWRDSDGKLRPEWGSTYTMNYPKNGVLFAEGNIRIKGALPADTQLTVVSNENIYIEGNILKNRAANATILNGVDTPAEKMVDDTSAISLLARKNVVVNTTMFMKPQMSIGPDMVTSDMSLSNEPPFHLTLSPLNIGRAFQWEFTFGPYESENNLFTANEWNLALRHSSDIDYVDAYLQVFDYSINDWTAIDWGTNSDPYTAAGNSIKNRIDGGTSLGAISSDSWKYKLNIFRLYPTDFNNISLGLNQYLKIFLDSNSRGDYILGNIAINPNDVRIEALLYAQNGSFFVIPGYWFEPENTITDDNYWDFGKPLDIKITIDGAISENFSADKSDQISWMEKWGTTYHPDTNKATSSIAGRGSYHGGQGLTILYDDTMAYPVYQNMPIRHDEYNRVLPITPKLPVSPSLIYKGIVE